MLWWSPMTASTTTLTNQNPTRGVGQMRGVKVGVFADGVAWLPPSQ